MNISKKVARGFASVFLFISSAAIFQSCTKIAGHSLTATAGAGYSAVPGGGSGAVDIGATNTIIFRINNDTTYTFSSPSYLVAFTTASVSGFPTLTTINGLSIANPTGNTFDLAYTGNTAGTYAPFIISIAVGKINLNTFGTTEKIVVNTENVTGTSSYGNSTGTCKGTFDGYMTKTVQVIGPLTDSVHVTGSFNIQQ